MPLVPVKKGPCGLYIRLSGRTKMLITCGHFNVIRLVQIISPTILFI